jgi:hypothetical protein
MGGRFGDVAAVEGAAEDQICELFGLGGLETLLDPPTAFATIVMLLCPGTPSRGPRVAGAAPA